MPPHPKKPSLPKMSPHPKKPPLPELPPQPKKTPHPKKPPLPEMPPHPKKPPVPKVTRTSRSKPKKQHEMMQTTTITKWFDLPLDLMVNILSRVVAIEKLWNVRKVCRDWRKICKDPSMWRVIYMDCKLWSDCRPYPWPSGLPIYASAAEITARKMCKNAVDRSQGQLVDITMVGFCDDELLEYVADRPPKLIRLKIAYPEFSVENLSKALKKLPKLEELSIHCAFKLQVDQALGRYYPELKTLRLNRWYSIFCDEEIIAICENLRELRHFEIRMNRSLSNTGLQAILDGCPCLKVLDLRLCPYVDLKGDIGKRLEQIERVLHTERVNVDPYSERGYFMDLETFR
ncbi:RNI-like superfamily protein, partial [Tanacetum coccineum]